MRNAYFIFLYKLKRLVSRLPGKRPVDISIFNPRIPRGVAVGNYTSINRGFRAVPMPNSKISIGKYCSIGPNCKLIAGDHPKSTPSSSVLLWMWQLRQLGEKKLYSFQEEAPITIKNDVWIGADVTILRGVTIGNGVVIGAGAVVTHDAPDYSVVAGNPARCVGKRFSDDILECLLEVNWWDWDDDKVEANASFFSTDISTMSPEQILSLIV
jgi:virginiamycin A acetyltransferase